MTAVLQPPIGIVIPVDWRSKRVKRWLDRLIAGWYYEEPVGQAGTELECMPPCYSIDGYTDTFFSTGGCTCSALTTETDQWDGVFRLRRDAGESIPPLPGETNTRRCAWSPILVDGEYEPDTVNDAPIYHARIGGDVTDYRTVLRPNSDDVWELRVGCQDGTAAGQVLWFGKNTGPNPVGTYTKDSGCSSVSEVTISRVSSHGCYCDIVEPCPSDCTDCADDYTAVVSGFTGDCATFNDTYTFSKSGAGCTWTEAPEDFGIIECRVAGNPWGYPNNYWGISGINVSFAIFGTGDCPDTGTYTLLFFCGVCAGQSGTIVLST